MHLEHYICSGIDAYNEYHDKYTKDTFKFDYQYFAIYRNKMKR